jgi:hypothetical protein
MGEHAVSRTRFALASAFFVAVVVGLGACASGGGTEGAKSAAPKAAAVADKPPPPGSKLAKVTLGMTDEDVRKVMGNPDSSKDYTTGKAWIPFYFGPDASRSEWMYKGQGRVVYSRSRYSGGLKVIRIMYDPKESGS